MREFEFLTEPLDEDEDVLGVFYGNAKQWGSQFVVTNRRLLMGPLDVGVADDILIYVMNKAGGPGDVLKSVLDRYGKAKTLWLRHVTRVEPTHGGSLFRAPGLRIRTDTGQTIDWAIVHKTTAMNRDPKNVAVRDRAVQVIREAVAEAKSR